MPCWAVGFFLTSLLLKKQQTFPARFAAGVAPATWLEQCQEQILLQDLIVSRNVNRHREKPLRSGFSQCGAVQAAAPELPTAGGSERPQRGRREEHGQGRAVRPMELFVITTLKMLHCTDWDCRRSPYLSCKALLIQQHCGRFFSPPAFSQLEKPGSAAPVYMTLHIPPCAFGKSRQALVWEPEHSWEPPL